MADIRPAPARHERESRVLGRSAFILPWIYRTVGRQRRYSLPALLLPLLAPVAGWATSYVPMTDEALVDRAPVIAVVKIEDSGPAPVGGRPATAYRARVQRLLKGAVATGLVTLHVPGGPRPDGRALKVWGAPRFRPGETALVFLSPRGDGSYDVFQLLLGAFHQVFVGGQRLAVRDLSGARAIELHGARPRSEPMRDFRRFVDWIEVRARGGVRSEAPYTVADSAGLQQLVDRYTLFADADGYNLRWFEFDAGNGAVFYAHEDGQPGVSGGGFAEFQTALQAWTADPATNIDYSYGGTTTASGGLSEYDGFNAIAFERDLGSPFDCSSGGILAWGGPWYYTDVTDYQGTPYHAIANGDIEVNEGIACFFTDSPDGSQAAAELFGHELGHTLGLDHSCGGGGGSCANPLLNEALMRAFIHDDGRGAQLNDDDRAGIAFLYTPAVPPASFYTLPPCRLLDTREPAGPYGGPPLGQFFTWQRTFTAAGRCGIPAGAVAISVNLTAVDPLNSGHLTVFPAGKPAPDTSALSFTTQQTRANNAVVGLSAASDAFTVEATLLFGFGSVHVVVDVNGYFRAVTP